MVLMRLSSSPVLIRLPVQDVLLKTFVILKNKLEIQSTLVLLGFEQFSFAVLLGFFTVQYDNEGFCAVW